LSFVLPYQRSIRPNWLLRTGLFFYDNLSRKNKLPRSKLIRRTPQSGYFSPLIDSYDKGFLFYDCATDDARLTITNALQAKERGASIQRDTALKEARVSNKLWHLTVQAKDGQHQVIKAKSIINAAGPWVQSINEILQIPSQFKMSLVK